jgi:hypothetical protein
MKRLLTLASLLAPTLVFAGEPAPDTVVAKAEATVKKELIQPLAAKELQRSRFSRARMPATARRVRVLDTAERQDDKGKTFVTFAIDARHGRYSDLEEGLDDLPQQAPKKEKDDGWRKDAITGCVYLASNEVFIKQGEGFRPAGILMGKKVKTAPEHTCKGVEGGLAAR